LARVPNAENAVIRPDKLLRYILSSTHPVGQPKAAYFNALGYNSDNWEMLEQCLRQLVSSQEYRAIQETEYGRKYIVEGPLLNKYARPVTIVTVWIILKDEDVPRFVTAYPGDTDEI